MITVISFSLNFNLTVLAKGKVAYPEGNGVTQRRMVLPSQVGYPGPGRAVFLSLYPNPTNQTPSVVYPELSVYAKTVGGIILNRLLHILKGLL